jgi:hypothetical protein
MITLIDALNELGVSAYCKNNDYDTIVWNNPEEAVSQEVLNAKVAEMQSAEDATQYQRDRAVAYPSIQDQLDKIYHSGLTAWKADIKAVKDKYPKP